MAGRRGRDGAADHADAPDQVVRAAALPGDAWNVDRIDIRDLMHSPGAPHVACAEARRAPAHAHAGDAARTDAESLSARVQLDEIVFQDGHLELERTIIILVVDEQHADELFADIHRSEEHTSELQSPDHLVCRLLLE